MQNNIEVNNFYIVRKKYSFSFPNFIHYRHQQYPHNLNKKEATLTASDSTEGELWITLRAVSPAHKFS